MLASCTVCCGSVLAQCYDDDHNDDEKKKKKQVQADMTRIYIIGYLVGEEWQQ